MSDAQANTQAHTAAQILAGWIVQHPNLCPPGVQCGRNYVEVDEQDCIDCYLTTAQKRARRSDDE